MGVSEAAAHLSCKPQRIYDLVHRQDQIRIPHVAQFDRDPRGLAGVLRGILAGL